MKSILALVAFLAWAAQPSVGAQSNPPRPNIVLMLADDLGETHNLAADQPQRTARLQDALEAARRAGRHPAAPKAKQ